MNKWQDEVEFLMESFNASGFVWEWRENADFFKN
jgi:hypothetical protein